MAQYGQRSTLSLSLCLSRLHLPYLSAEVDLARQCRQLAMLNENAIKGDLPYPRDVEFNEHNFSRMAIFSCGMTNSDRWYISGSNSQYVIFSSVVYAAN